jgi:hypothetical protein
VISGLHRAGRCSAKSKIIADSISLSKPHFASSQKIQAFDGSSRSSPPI